jgi:predicted small metal-binding protein
MEIMASSLSHGFLVLGDGSSSSSSCDDEILEQLFVHMDRKKKNVFACVIVVANSFHVFNANELEEGANQLMDLGVRV